MAINDTIASDGQWFAFESIGDIPSGNFDAHMFKSDNKFGLYDNATSNSGMRYYRGLKHKDTKKLYAWYKKN